MRVIQNKLLSAGEKKLRDTEKALGMLLDLRPINTFQLYSFRSYQKTKMWESEYHLAKKKFISEILFSVLIV